LRAACPQSLLCVLLILALSAVGPGCRGRPAKGYLPGIGAINRLSDAQIRERIEQLRKQASANSQSQAPLPHSNPVDKLREEHNSRVAEVTTLWARLEISWQSNRMRPYRRLERFEGHIVFRAPDEFAFTAHKLGDDLFWIGSNPDFVWSIDPVNDEAWIIRSSNIGQEGAKLFPIFAHPLLLRNLLALDPMPKLTEHFPPASGSSFGMITGGERIVTTNRDGLYWAMHFDAHSPLARGVHALIRSPEKEDTPYAISTLDDYKVLTDDPTNGTLLVPTSIAVRIQDLGEMKIDVDAVRTTPPLTNRIIEDIFDFFAVSDRFPSLKINVLDENCPRPAIPTY